jgi:hypothetical protein
MPLAFSIYGWLHGCGGHKQIESFSIEQLAELRDRVNTLLAEGVSDRQRELSSEADRLKREEPARKIGALGGRSW